MTTSKKYFAIALINNRIEFLEVRKSKSFFPPHLWINRHILCQKYASIIYNADSTPIYSGISLYYSNTIFVPMFVYSKPISSETDGAIWIFFLLTLFWSGEGFRQKIFWIFKRNSQNSFAINFEFLKCKYHYRVKPWNTQ